MLGAECRDALQLGSDRRELLLARVAVAFGLAELWHSTNRRVASPAPRADLLDPQVVADSTVAALA
jgi:hypothetical protein